MYCSYFLLFFRPSHLQPTMIRTLLISIPLVRVYSTLNWERRPSNFTLYVRLYRLPPICVHLHQRDYRHQELLRSLSRWSRHGILYAIAVNLTTFVTCPRRRRSINKLHHGCLHHMRCQQTMDLSHMRCSQPQINRSGLQTSNFHMCTRFRLPSFFSFQLIRNQWLSDIPIHRFLQF